MTIYSGAQASEFDLYVEKLTMDFVDELQAEGNKLSGVFETDSQDGQFIKIDKIGQRNSVKLKTSILEPISYSGDIFEERLCDFETFYDAAVTDPDEIIRMAKDPSDAKKRNMMKDFGRTIDRYLISKFESDVSVRAGGSLTTLTFANDSGQTITVNDHSFASSAATNDICLTPSKLKKAQQLLLSAFVDLNDIFVIGSSKQFMKLMTFNEVVNADFRGQAGMQPLNQKAFAGLQGYLGMNFIAIDDSLALPLDSNSDETVYVVARSAMKVRQPKGLEVIVDQDPNLVGKPWRIQVILRLGAVRTEGAKVIHVACDPTTNIPA